ncbi:MAG: M36 family metallopeptidase [Rhodothermales bacterium]
MSCASRRAALALCVLVGAAGARAQEATYRVYPAPVESPTHTEPAPPADARALVADPADPSASPFGWHDTDGTPGPEFTTTEGNNAVVYFGEPDGVADGGPTLGFDFPLALADGPSGYVDAALTNLFYWTNYAHDVLYAYGFDEAAGNFQENTYGRGGVGGDPVRVELTEGTGNVSFFTPPDGSRPRLRLALAPLGDPLRHGAYDNGLVVHELAHGLSTRLTGGPSNSGCLSNAEQMGEGWSDYYALMLTMRDADARTDARGFGTYALGEPPDGPGSRPAPYSTSFAVNDFTHGDIATLSVPSGVGFVWATVLWEMTWDLADAHGFSPDLLDGDGSAGNQVALQLVTEAMKLQPCSPGFVDGRDAILAADDALHDGANHDLLWAAFARRGLGFSAAQGSSASTADNIEAFDLPPATDGEPESALPRLVLDPVTPNPAFGDARVGYALTTPGPVRLTVFDVRGRTVAVLADGVRGAGRHAERLDTRTWASGVYLLRLEAGGTVQTRRFTVVR